MLTARLAPARAPAPATEPAGPQARVSAVPPEAQAAPRRWFAMASRSASFPPRFHVGFRQADNFCVLGGGSPREELFADEALAHALTDDNEHLADLVGECAGRASLVFVVCSHVASRGQPPARGFHPDSRARDGNSR